MKDYEALSKKHFDAQAPEYDQRDTVYYSREGKISCRDIAAILKDTAYADLLDVGCGTGFLLDLLAKQQAAHYAGLDLSPEMIRMARQKDIPGAELTEGSADRLPFPDESFDIVTCSQSFHHYPYPEKAMAEAFRHRCSSLRNPGGGGCGGSRRTVRSFCFPDDAGRLLHHSPADECLYYVGNGAGSVQL